jgi:hypothetical protein
MIETSFMLLKMLLGAGEHVMVMLQVADILTFIKAAASMPKSRHKQSKCRHRLKKPQS